MLKTLAVVTLTLMAASAASAASAHAEPGNIDEGANYRVFLQAIEQDGITMDSSAAIREALGVCGLIEPPDGASLWEAGQHLMSTHPAWTVTDALHFADRAIQNICPHRGSF